MDEFDTQLGSQLASTLGSFNRIYVGFSGGLDSCVLLHVLSQKPLLRRKITAIHINHHISPYADNWAVFAQKTAQFLQIPCEIFSVVLDKKSNLEESAREARYAIFSSLLQNSLDVLILAHHQNDQAETLLMHLFRGAGIDGLAGIPEWRRLGKGQIYRPFLQLLRADLEHYAKERKLAWIEDESNRNLHFDRNFLRHQIIPQLEKRWPGLIPNLCRSARHCSQAKQYIQTDIIQILEEIVDKEQRLSIRVLLSYSRDTQCFVLREWLGCQGFKKPSQNKIERILDELIVAKPDGQPFVGWREGQVRRYQGLLYAISVANEKKYDFGLQEKLAELKKQYPEAKFEIRYRQGGETMQWHGQTHLLKKLLQEWKVPPWERNCIPLIYKDNVLIEVFV